MDQTALKAHLHTLIDELSDETVLRSVYVLLSVSRIKEGTDWDWLEQLPATIKEHFIHGMLQAEGIEPSEREAILKELTEKYPQLRLDGKGLL